MWWIIPPHERIPDAIVLGTLGLVVSYLWAKFIYWWACRGSP